MAAGKPEPVTIEFCDGDLALVFDQYGNQMVKFQFGCHRDTIKALTDAGIDWRELEIIGAPQA